MLPNLEALWWASDPVLMRFHRFRYKGGGASPQHETRNQIGRNSLTLLECSLGIRYVLMAHQEHKKSADPHQAAESSVEIFSFERPLSRTWTLAGQATLPSPRGKPRAEVVALLRAAWKLCDAGRISIHGYACGRMRLVITRAGYPRPPERWPEGAILKAGKGSKERRSMNTREPTGALNPGDSIEGQMLSVTIPKSFSSCAPRWISAEMPELFIGPLAAAQNRRLAQGRQAHARNAGFCGRGGALPRPAFL
jgi:hypothetical protein